jgi:hypothetical protein
MAKSKRKSGTGLVSEGIKKAGRGVGDLARRAVGGKPRTNRISAGGLMSEGAKKAGHGIGRAAKSAVGMKSSRKK